MTERYSPVLHWRKRNNIMRLLRYYYYLQVTQVTVLRIVHGFRELLLDPERARLRRMNMH